MNTIPLDEQHIAPDARSVLIAAWAEYKGYGSSAGDYEVMERQEAWKVKSGQASWMFVIGKAVDDSLSLKPLPCADYKIENWGERIMVVDQGPDESIPAVTDFIWRFFNRFPAYPSHEFLVDDGPAKLELLRYIASLAPYTYLLTQEFGTYRYPGVDTGSLDDSLALANIFKNLDDIEKLRNEIPDLSANTNNEMDRYELQIIELLKTPVTTDLEFQAKIAILVCLMSRRVREMYDRLWEQFQDGVLDAKKMPENVKPKVISRYRTKAEQELVELERKWSSIGYDMDEKRRNAFIERQMGEDYAKDHPPKVNRAEEERERELAMHRELARLGFTSNQIAAMMDPIAQKRIHYANLLKWGVPPDRAKEYVYGTRLRAYLKLAARVGVSLALVASGWWAGQQFSNPNQSTVPTAYVCSVPKGCSAGQVYKLVLQPDGSLGLVEIPDFLGDVQPESDAAPVIEGLDGSSLSEPVIEDTIDLEKPTATTTSTATAVPTLAPTATSTPAPTATMTSVPASTSTPMPTATSAPIVVPTSTNTAVAPTATATVQALAPTPQAQESPGGITVVESFDD